MIFACPRTGTTVIQKMIELEFNTSNLVEPFNDPGLKLDPIYVQTEDLYEWVKKQKTCTMKLLATNLALVDVDRLLAHGNFDRIVVVERKNLTDCCVSLCLAEKQSKYHYMENETVNIDPFECSSEFVTGWINMYRQYVIALEKITHSGVPCDTICYEDFMNDQPQQVADVELQLSKMNIKILDQSKKTVALNLPYQDLCINYHNVEETIRKALC